MLHFVMNNTISGTSELVYYFEAISNLLDGFDLWLLEATSSN